MHHNAFAQPVPLQYPFSPLLEIQATPDQVQVPPAAELLDQSQPPLFPELHAGNLPVRVHVAVRELDVVVPAVGTFAVAARADSAGGPLLDADGVGRYGYAAGSVGADSADVVAAEVRGLLVLEQKVPLELYCSWACAVACGEDETAVLSPRGVGEEGEDGDGGGDYVSHFE